MRTRLAFREKELAVKEAQVLPSVRMHTSYATACIRHTRVGRQRGADTPLSACIPRVLIRYRIGACIPHTLPHAVLSSRGSSKREAHAYLIR